ncbi:tetratricopeptide repeat protein [Brachyspira pilosicoli]
MENKENTENNKQTTKKEKRNYQMDNYNVMIKLFILSMIVFAALYFAHNLLVSYRLDKAMEKYSSPLENIIITKEEFYTNVIITEIESNKFITNNIILKSSSIEDLQNAFSEAIDSHTKNLQISMSEIVKSSSDTLNFWFAFISVVMIVFSFAGAFVNNNILNEAKAQLKNVEKESKISMKKIELATKELIEKNDKNIKINGLFNLAYQAANKEDYNSAMEYYKQILGIDPENYTAYYGLGLYEDYLKEYEKSIEYFDNAIKYNNKYVDAYFNRGLSKMKLKRYDEALSDYSFAIELDNKYIKAYRNICFIKNELAEKEVKENNLDYAYTLLNEALEYINKAIKIDNFNERAYSKDIAKKNLNIDVYSQRYLVRAMIKSNMYIIEIKRMNFNNSKKLLEEINDDYKQSIKLGSNNVSIYNKISFRKIKLANMEYELGNKGKAEELLNEALEYCDKGIEIVDDNAEIYDTRGYAKTKLANIERYNGNIEKAIEIYNECLKDFYKAIELNHEHSYALNSIGYIKNILANIQKESISEEEYKHLKDEALLYFEKAYKIDNDKLKPKMEKYLIKLAKENDTVGIEFCTKNNIDYAK